jgi:hypothetical protein
MDIERKGSEESAIPQVRKRKGPPIGGSVRGRSEKVEIFDHEALDSGIACAV